MMERKYTEKIASVPLRELAKSIVNKQIEVFDMWMNGQMQPITNNGGMPKPAGRV